MANHAAKSLQHLWSELEISRAALEDENAPNAAESARESLRRAVIAAEERIREWAAHWEDPESTEAGLTLIRSRAGRRGELERGAARLTMLLSERRDQMRESAQVPAADRAPSEGAQGAAGAVDGAAGGDTEPAEAPGAGAAGQDDGAGPSGPPAPPLSELLRGAPLPVSERTFVERLDAPSCRAILIALKEHFRQNRNDPRLRNIALTHTDAVDVLRLRILDAYAREGVFELALQSLLASNFNAYVHVVTRAATNLTGHHKRFNEMRAQFAQALRRDDEDGRLVIDSFVQQIRSNQPAGGASDPAMDRFREFLRDASLPNSREEFVERLTKPDCIHLLGILKELQKEKKQLGKLTRADQEFVHLDLKRSDANVEQLRSKLVKAFNDSPDMFQAAMRRLRDQQTEAFVELVFRVAGRHQRIADGLRQQLNDLREALSDPDNFVIILNRFLNQFAAMDD
ncbi:unnamed protein product [Pedinophyceae sp. YPF-701]|nr:unnamed protein product [Pedinophyceae sp. YPF-701]